MSQTKDYAAMDQDEIGAEVARATDEVLREWRAIGEPHAGPAVYGQAVAEACRRNPEMAARYNCSVKGNGPGTR